MDIETDNVFDKAETVSLRQYREDVEASGLAEEAPVFVESPPKRSVWDFPLVDLERFYEDDGNGGNGVHAQSTILIKVLPHQEAELIVILEEWMGQRL